MTMPEPSAGDVSVGSELSVRAIPDVPTVNAGDHLLDVLLRKYMETFLFAGKVTEGK